MHVRFGQQWGLHLLKSLEHFFCFSASICLITGFHHPLFYPDTLGHKGPQRMTNWGLASFTDAELEVRKKSWQERKNQGAQAQWISPCRMCQEESDCMSSHCHSQGLKSSWDFIYFIDLRSNKTSTLIPFGWCIWQNYLEASSTNRFFFLVSKKLLRAPAEKTINYF